MSLTDEKASQLIEGLEISSEGHQNKGCFSLPTKTHNTQLKDLPAQILLTSFTNRRLVIVTQTGKPGSLFEVRRKESCVDVQVLLGPDSEEFHFAGHALGTELELNTPTLFALGLSSPLTPSLVSEIIAKLKPLLA